MPNIKDQSTVEAIAREYCSNGRNKGEALRTIGYKDSYCNTRGIGVVYSNVRVIEAIKAIDDKTAARIEFNREVALENNNRIMIAAEKAGQLSAAVSANNSNMRLFALDQQVIKTEHTPDQPTGKEAEAVEQAAKEYKLKLAGSA
jgi:hypothetical protein